MIGIRGKAFKLVFVVLLLVLGTTFMFFSCNIGFDRAETPHYLYFKNIDLSTKLHSEGAPSHDITELWIYANGDFLGAFNKQKPIPVISNSENIELNIFAGIRANGSKQDIQLYYLLQDISFVLKYSEGKIDTLDAVFNYSDNANFVFIEDFENGNIFTNDLDGDPNTAVSVSKTDPHSGVNCGKIIMDSENSTFKVTSSADFFQIPQYGNVTFLELDYKCNSDMIIGLTGKDLNSGQEYSNDIIYLTEQENWNKLYLNLTSTIQNSGLGLYKIYFKSEHDTKNDKTEISLDNIKLLYLKK